MALLAATKKTGELRVVGGKLDGRVHLDAGKVVGADVGRADSFVDAVFELLRLTTGKFSFDADKAPADPADPVDIEPLLLEAGARLTEWRGIEAVVPSMDHAVELVKDLGDPHVTLAADQWRMVVAVAGATCVHQVADRLGLGEYAVCKSLKDLVESGVVLVADPPKAAAKPAPKPEPVAEKKPEPVVEAQPEPQPDPEPEPVAEAEPEPVAKPVAEKKPEPKPAEKKSEAKAEAPVVIEPERKPEAATGKVAVPALTTKDQTSPIPPGEEPGAAKPAKKAAAPVASTSGKSEDAAPAAAAPKQGVSSSQAKALVSQLAAMSSEKTATPKAKAADAEAEEAKGDKKDESAEAPAAEAASAAEGGDADEPLNRGLLLKFLSSVRQ